jgi:hypothetical protein
MGAQPGLQRSVRGHAPRRRRERVGGADTRLARSRPEESLGFDAKKRKRQTATDAAVCADKMRADPSIHPDRAVVFERKTASKVVPLLETVMPEVADAGGGRKKSLLSEVVAALTDGVERRGAPQSAMEAAFGTATRPAPRLPANIEARLAGLTQVKTEPAGIKRFFGA